jgi:putative membrane protein
MVKIMKPLLKAATAATTGLAVLMLAATPGFADASGGLWRNDHMAWSWMSGMHGMFWPMTILVIVAILFVAFYLGTHGEGSHEAAAGFARHQPHGSARDILDQRYARGEIDRDDYLDKKRELS